MRIVMDMLFLSMLICGVVKVEASSKHGVVTLRLHRSLLQPFGLSVRYLWLYSYLFSQSAERLLQDEVDAYGFAIDTNSY